MTEVNFIQETAPFIEAKPPSSEPQPPKPNHSELSSPSQSLRALNSNKFAFYYETIDQQAMQSTSTSDSKACKKRDSTGSIRHGFIAKKNLNKKQCNGIIPVVQPSQAAQRILCPGAPRNTTSFLIDDMEERQSRDVSPPTPSVSPSSRGVRCRSTSATEASTSECPIARIFPAEEDNEQEIVNDDFCSDYHDMVEQLCSERLNSISRDQINKQFLHLEEHNRDLINHFTRLREENDNLKQLLRANNIDIPQASS